MRVLLLLYKIEHVQAERGDEKNKRNLVGRVCINVLWLVSPETMVVHHCISWKATALNIYFLDFNYQLLKAMPLSMMHVMHQRQIVGV